MNDATDTPGQEPGAAAPELWQMPPNEAAPAAESAEPEREPLILAHTRPSIWDKTL